MHISLRSEPALILCLLIPYDFLTLFSLMSSSNERLFILLSISDNNDGSDRGLGIGWLHDTLPAAKTQPSSVVKDIPEKVSQGKGKRNRFNRKSNGYTTRGSYSTTVGCFQFTSGQHIALRVSLFKHIVLYIGFSSSR